MLVGKQSHPHYVIVGSSFTDVWVSGHHVVNDGGYIFILVSTLYFWFWKGIANFIVPFANGEVYDWDGMWLIIKELYVHSRPFLTYHPHFSLLTDTGVL